MASRFTGAHFPTEVLLMGVRSPARRPEGWSKISRSHAPGPV